MQLICAFVFAYAKRQVFSKSLSKANANLDIQILEFHCMVAVPLLKCLNNNLSKVAKTCIEFIKSCFLLVSVFPRF